MTEKILLLSGANGTELTRMMARFHCNSLGLRIMNAAEFARFALMRSGIVLEESFLPRKQEAAVIDGFVREIAYFAFLPAFCCFSASRQKAQYFGNGKKKALQSLEKYHILW